MLEILTFLWGWNLLYSSVDEILTFSLARNLNIPVLPWGWNHFIPARSENSNVVKILTFSWGLKSS